LELSQTVWEIFCTNHLTFTNGLCIIRATQSVCEYIIKRFGKFVKGVKRIVAKCFTLRYEQLLRKRRVYTNSSDSFKYYEFTDAENATEFDAYVAKCKELSLYDTGVSAEYGDKLISLSTCEYSRSNGRLVVVAKRVD